MKGSADTALLMRMILALRLGDKANSTKPAYLRSQIIETFLDLGHAYLDGSHIKPATTVLARLPIAGIPVGVICGARSPEILGRVRASSGRRCKILFDSTSQLEPTRILLTAEGSKDLADTATEAGIGYSNIPPSWTIAKDGGGLPEELARLKWEEDDTIAGWSAWQFSTRRLRFQAGLSGSVPGGRIALRKFISRTYDRRYWLVSDGKHAEVDPNWGRYMALKSDGVNAASYEAKSMRFAFPATVPLPRLYSKALALCSGKSGVTSPPTGDRPPTKTFSKVPEIIANSILLKLGQV
jgi:hypothetical protein